MTFKDRFCPSPWFHMRITNAGRYEYCRWANDDVSEASHNIKQISPLHYFQKDMAPIRQQMLDGREISGCAKCYRMEQHGKVSGRQKQLLKTGVVLEKFQKTMLSSPWIDAWKQSQDHQGETDVCVQDWQIDLGNFCNSACLFCRPEFSSRLATEQFKLGIIPELPPRSWCDDQAALDRFIQDLIQSPRLQYLHFIGGETIITPAFKVILQALVDANLAKQITVGFTTNLTIMDQEIVDLLARFHQINLGISIECLDRANDYIRYGSDIQRAKFMIDSWVSIAKERDWLVQIRTTPTILSISRLTTIYDYAWDNSLAVESCNFIEEPRFMRPCVLPMPYRQQVRDKLQSWVDGRGIDLSNDQVINIRNPAFVQQQILQDMRSYIRYLDHEPDLSFLLPNLIRYLKIMESNRGNSVLDYLPEYEELFRTAGY